MPIALDAIRQAVRGTPYERDLFLVGGAVRDALLGLPAQSDIDLVTTLPVEPLVEQLRPLSSIDPVIYERFGTAMLRIGQEAVELVQARKESYEGGSRKPQVEPATLEQDALRRDFTANALMRRLDDGELLDPTGRGLRDLEAKILRTPLDPHETFRDDPLRMLRAVRFRWKLDFEPANGLYAAIGDCADRLAIVSEERVRDELRKIMVGPRVAQAWADLMNLGLTEQFAPEFTPMVGCEQGHYHHLDVWDHSLLVLQKTASAQDETLNWSALLHDIGKPGTRSIDPQGNVRFFSHETEGARIAGDILRRLRFSTREIEPIELLIANHMRLGSFQTLSPSAARRLIRDLGDETDRLLQLVEADASSLAPGVRKMDLGPIRQSLASAKASTPRDSLVSPLSGAEIMTLLHLTPGKRVGQIKSDLTEAVIEGAVAPGDKVAAQKWVTERYSLGL